MKVKMPEQSEVSSYFDSGVKKRKNSDNGNGDKKKQNKAENKQYAVNSKIGMPSVDDLSDYLQEDNSKNEGESLTDGTKNDASGNDEDVSIDVDKSDSGIGTEYTQEKLDEILAALKKDKDDYIDDLLKNEFNLDFLKNDDRTDAQLEEIAKAEYNAKAQTEKEQLKDETSTKVEQLENSINQQEENKALRLQDISDNYDQAKTDAERQALKRGIGRSSVILNLLKQYDEQKMSALDQTNNEYLKKTEQLNSQINQLDAELKNSLQKYDMYAAYQINERLNELKKERDENNAEILKYNNQLKEKLAKFKTELDNSTYGKKILSEIRDKKNANEAKTNELVFNYLQNMPYKKAKELLDSGLYDEYLYEADKRILKNILQNQTKIEQGEKVKKET